MQTTNVTEELQRILTALAEEGKEPSVALVKARLSSPVPMPALITTIKAWKSSNKVPKVEIAKQEETLTPEQRIEQLESQVKALTARLEQLEQRL
ncbi:MAG: hypothetical protein ACK5NC_08935 [Vibrio sp.]